MRPIYTRAHLDFLRENFPLMICRDLVVTFNHEFGTNKTHGQIMACVKNHKITAGRSALPGTIPRMLTPEQEAFVRKEYPIRSRESLTNVVNKKFGLALTVQQIITYTKNHNIKSGRTGRFEKGNVSWNKGTKGLVKANSGSFKSGDIPANTKPLGHERTCTRDGYILIKVAERNPYTGALTRYKHKHLVVWELANGPVPKGSMIRLLDGDKMNCDIDNLFMVTRAENAYLNCHGYNDISDELKPSFRALAKLISNTSAATKQAEAA
jgi:hypothetical protein